jgi:hypothetical protein
VVVERQAVAVHGLQRELLRLVIVVGAVALPAAVAVRRLSCSAAGRAGLMVAWLWRRSSARPWQCTGCSVSRCAW